MPTNKIFFTPGPTHMYPSVEQHTSNAFKENICSVSHRSAVFHTVFDEATENIKNLLDIPDSHRIVFTSSATEVWERFLQSCVSESSFHFVNGSFSKKFFQFSEQLQNQAYKNEVPLGKGFEFGDFVIKEDVEAIGIASNETSAGVYTQVSDISKLKENNPDRLLYVDAVSAIPYPDFEWEKIDSLMFSVQKGFGLPAGLGVWVIGPKAIEAAEKKKSKGEIIGTYNNLLTLLKNADKSETSCTPNVLGIYLAGKVAGDMLAYGKDKIKKDIEYKSQLAYDFLEKSSQMSAFVENKYHQSPTVIVADTGTDSSEVINHLKSFNFVVGSGYGDYKKKHIRIANFPCHSLEKFEELIETLKKYYS